MKNKTASVLFISVLLLILMLFFGLIGTMAYFQNHHPSIYETLSAPIGISTVVVGAAGLVVIFIFGAKALEKTILYERERNLNSCKAFIPTHQITQDYGQLLQRITTNLESDGFSITHNLQLQNYADVILAHTVKYTFSQDYVGHFLFFVHADNFMLEDYPPLMISAYEYINNTEKKRRFFTQTNRIIVCIFTDEIHPEVAEKANEMYDEQLQFITVIYDLQTGHVYYMNGKSGRFSRLTKMQNLARQYITDETYTKS